MNAPTKHIVLTLFVALLAAPLLCAADDLTTYVETGNNRLSRYLVNLGRANGNTSRGRNTTAVKGVFDYPKNSGNAGDGGMWWRMNDGLTDNPADTFYHFDPGADTNEWFGYIFKVPATVESLLLVDHTYGDGGPFAWTPDVQVLTGSRSGTWQTVSATWSPSTYNNAVGRTSETYSITLDTPAANVWGVRLYAPARYQPMADPSGFIACREFRVNGSVTYYSKGVLLIISNNLAQAAGTTPIMNYSQHAIGRIVDGSVAKDNSFSTTYGAGGATRDYFGVTWDAYKNNVGAVGWTLRIFGDGGWIKKDTLDVEYTTDGGSSWSSVSGLDASLYNETITTLVANRNTAPASDMDVSYLITFDALNGINGLRISGEPGGTADINGFVSVIEFEVFQVIPEPGMLLGALAALALLRRRR